ncbi:MAG: glutamine--fructose-6-phosphate aminotransferase, partial [Anaerovoracaceae bacterium]
MCGIVGYIGKDNNAKEIIIDGLKKLEYRGYDSAGIAVVRNGSLEIKKHVGGIENLENLIGDDHMASHV